MNLKKLKVSIPKGTLKEFQPTNKRARIANGHFYSAIHNNDLFRNTAKGYPPNENMFGHMDHHSAWVRDLDVILDIEYVKEFTFLVDDADKVFVLAFIPKLKLYTTVSLEDFERHAI